MVNKVSKEQREDFDKYIGMGMDEVSLEILLESILNDKVDKKVYKKADKKANKKADKKVDKKVNKSDLEEIPLNPIEKERTYIYKDREDNEVTLTFKNVVSIYKNKGGSTDRIKILNELGEYELVIINRGYKAIRIKTDEFTV